MKQLKIHQFFKTNPNEQKELRIPNEVTHQVAKNSNEKKITDDIGEGDDTKHLKDGTIFNNADPRDLDVNQKLCTFSGNVITVHDYKTLTICNLLNDAIIDFY